MKLDKYLDGHPIFDQSKRLLSLCKPLFDAGINFFSHAYVDKNQAFTCLATAPSACEHYFNNHHYEFDLHKKSFQKGEQYIVWDFLHRFGGTKQLEDDFTRRDMGHTFSIVRARESTLDIYHFALPIGDVSKNQFYLNNIHHLKKFILHYHDEISRDPLLARAYQRSLSLSKEEGGFLIENKETPVFIPPLKRILVNGNESHLSLREYECLHWLAHGKTVDEVSDILVISSRTVKAHITNMKMKLGCVNLFQLGMVYRGIESEVSCSDD